MLRQHIPESGYTGYTQLFHALFKPLGPEAQRDVATGAETFRRNHPDTLLYPDPFVEPKRPASVFHAATLQLVVGEDPGCRRAALALRAALKTRFGFEPPIRADATDCLRDRATGPVVVLGGADRNAGALEIARKYQVGLFCSGFPGAGGWGLTTHWELDPNLPPRYILTFDDTTQETAVNAFCDQAVSEHDRPLLRWAHCVAPGPERAAAPASFTEWLAKFPVQSHFETLRQWTQAPGATSYREIFLNFYLDLQRNYASATAGSNTGLPYNAIAVDLGIAGLRRYQACGDLEGLTLFREMLAGLRLYLDSANPLIYISDIDFRMGTLCNYWNWIADHPEVTDAERLSVPLLLLALTRMVRDYFRSHWKHKGTPDGQWTARHNHQTFKASSLACAWRYFQRFDVPDAATWKAEADAIFEAINPAMFKQSENAGNYETFVPEHTLVWMEVMDRTPSSEKQDALALFAKREWVTRDAFLYPLDYGDSDPVLEPTRPFEVSPWISGASAIQREIIDLESSCAAFFPWRPAQSVRYFAGLHRAVPGVPFKGQNGWQRMPLDSAFACQAHCALAPGEAFDKLAWRSGWTPESAYLALEGIGNTTVGHAHNEVNGILRLNLAGRIWLVSNGYGKKGSRVDAAKSFSSRQRGPEEHNMLIVRPEPGGAAAIPPVNARLLDLGDAPLPFAVSELGNYSGVDWRRHLLILPDTGVIVIDRLHPVQGATLPASVELQWNLIGAHTAHDKFSTLDQQAATLEVHHFQTARPEWRESPVEVWRHRIQAGDYPYACEVPRQLILRPQSAMRDTGLTFITGFWLSGTIRNPRWNPDDNELRFDFPLAGDNTASALQRPWGSVSRTQDTWRIRL